MALSKNDLKQIKQIVDQATLPYFTAIKSDFNRIDKKFAGIDKKFAGIDKKFAGIDKRFDNMDKRFDQAAKERAEIKSRLDDLENKVDSLERRIICLEDILTEQACELNKHTKQLKAIRVSIKNLQMHYRVSHKEVQDLGHRVKIIEDKLAFIS